MAPTPTRSPGASKKVEKIWVVLVALHSYAVMLFLLFFTRWGVEFGGWVQVEPLFFARQSGIFHGVVATGYLWEYFRHQSMVLMLIAKCAAVVFLTSMMWIEPSPWAVPLSALGDGLMGAATAFFIWRSRR